MKQRNNYHHIGKMLNQSWEQWFNKIQVNDYVLIDRSWRSGKARRALNRLRKKGYFKQISATKFIKTNKVWISGDAPEINIAFSKKNNNESRN